MYSREQILNLSNLIVDTVHPDKIILFGSYAYGKPTSKSDVDLMVIMKDPDMNDDDKVEALQKIFKQRVKSLKKWINSDISIVSWNDINAKKDDTDSAIYDALRKGKVLYDKNAQGSFEML